MDRHDEMGMGWGRFAAMIGTATVIMFFLMYQLVYQLDHATFSVNRVISSLVMGSVMAAVMLGFMWSMHPNRKANIGILVGAAALMAVALWLSRSQAFVDERAYMKGMIPHHSIAILTSERADLDDVRVCELANDSIIAQREEIDEMDWLIDDIEANGVASTSAEAESRPVPEFDVAAERVCAPS